jgi:hypothetical protein
MDYISQSWSQHRIAGAYYHKDESKDAMELLALNLKRGVQPFQLLLLRDPGNRYDKNAIKVVDRTTGKLIGWVPKEENANLAMMMDKLPIKVEAAVAAHSNFQAMRLFMGIRILFPVDMSAAERLPGAERINWKPDGIRNVTITNCTTTGYDPKWEPSKEDLLVETALAKVRAKRTEALSALDAAKAAMGAKPAELRPIESFKGGTVQLSDYELDI